MGESDVRKDEAHVVTRESDVRKDEAPVVTIVERRRQRQVELSSAEIMKILRKRSSKRGSRNPEGA